MQSTWFDPHKSFLSLPILWWFVGLMVLTAIIIASTIILNSNIESDFSYTGFNQCIVIFQVPLGILALTIPVVALLAANHRSEQSKESMRLTNVQNNFSNFYKHLEEFGKHIDGLEEKYSVIKANRRSLYSILFPNSMNGDYKIALSFVDNLNDYLEKHCDLIGKFAFLEEDIKKKLHKLGEIEGDYLAIFNGVIDFPLREGVQYKDYGEYMVALAEGEITEYLNGFRIRMDFLHQLFSFDTLYVNPEYHKNRQGIEYLMVALPTFIVGANGEITTLEASIL